jgi:AmmeMemoRadiSam system protein B
MAREELKRGIIVFAMTGPSTDAGTDARPGAGGIRAPAFAGLFYPDDADGCRQLARQFVSAGRDKASKSAGNRKWLGGIVPHAGWICSGAVAGETIGAIAAASAGADEKSPDVVVVFGAVHTPAPLQEATLDTFASWSVPGAHSSVSSELRAKLIEQGRELFRADDRFHRREHAVEVELPLVQAAWPGATILPVEVPLIDEAPQVGIATATRIAAMAGTRAVFLASSDLTHYGPSYRFAPAGVGLSGLAWAKTNDQRLLERVAAMDVEGIVAVVRDNYNACGGGAIAAMLAACRELGATNAVMLRHTNSYETLWEQGFAHETENAVGYAAVVVG